MIGATAQFVFKDSAITSLSIFRLEKKLRTNPSRYKLASRYWFPERQTLSDTLFPRGEYFEAIFHLETSALGVRHDPE